MVEIRTKQWQPLPPVTSIYVQPSGVSAAHYRGTGEVLCASSRFDPSLTVTFSGLEFGSRSLIAIEGMLRSISTENGYDPKEGEIAVCYPSIGVLARTMKLEEPVDLTKVSVEARRLMGFSPNQHHLFYSRLKDGDYRIHLTPKKPLDELTELARWVKLKRPRLGFDHTALGTFYKIREGLLMDVNFPIAGSFIFHDEIPRMERVFSYYDKGEFVDSLAKEAARCLGFYNDVFPTEAIPRTTPIHLVGDIPSDFKDRVEKETGYPVVILPPEPFAVALGLIRQLYEKSPFIFDIGETNYPSTSEQVFARV